MARYESRSRLLSEEIVALTKEFAAAHRHRFPRGYGQLAADIQRHCCTQRA